MSEIVEDTGCEGCHNAEVTGSPCKMGYTACNTLLTMDEHDECWVHDMGNHEHYQVCGKVIADESNQDLAVLVVHHGRDVLKIQLNTIRAVRAKHFGDGSVQYHVVFN